MPFCRNERYTKETDEIKGKTDQGISMSPIEETMA